MSLYSLDVQDENFVYNINSLEQKGIYKIATILDGYRLLQNEHRLSWYYGQSIDRDDCNDMVRMFHSYMKSLESFFELDITDYSTQSIAQLIECSNEYLIMTNQIIEKSVVNGDVSFTSDVYLARQIRPIIQAIMRALEELYIIAKENVLANLVSRTYQTNNKTEDELLDDLRLHLERAACMINEDPNTFKALWGTNLRKILMTSSDFMHSRGQDIREELSWIN